MAIREAKRNMALNVEPTHCGVDEAEAMTGVSRWTWRSYCYAGKIESCKVGARLLIPVSEIKRVLTEGTRHRRDGRAAGEPAEKSRRAAIVRSPDAGRHANA